MTIKKERELKAIIEMVKIENQQVKIPTTEKEKEDETSADI